MQRILLVVALAAIFLFVAMNIYRFPSNRPAPAPTAQVQGLRTIQLKGESIRVSVADTGQSREQGLSGRQSLAPDEGMLFVFPEDGIYAFWMKDMRFSIDIVWLAADGRLVYMAQNVSPDTYPRTFGPNTAARYVLELPAGYLRGHAVSIGDIVRL